MMRVTALVARDEVCSPFQVVHHPAGDLGDVKGQALAFLLVVMNKHRDPAGHEVAVAGHDAHQAPRLAPDHVPSPSSSCREPAVAAPPRAGHPFPPRARYLLPATGPRPLPASAWPSCRFVPWWSSRAGLQTMDGRLQDG